MKTDFQTGLPIIECCGIRLGVIKMTDKSLICEICHTVYASDIMANISLYKLDLPNPSDQRAGGSQP